MKNSNATKKSNHSLVHINHNTVFTDSMVIAECVGLTHKRVIALIRKYQADLKEFGFLTFETAKNRGTQGLQSEYAELNEDQATFLMMLFKPSPIVIKFRVQLVKAFRKALNEIDRLRNQTTEPAWKFVRDESKLGFKWMAASLKEQREAIGKETANIHYMNEAKLVNSVITGCFAGIDRNTLPCSELAFIGEIQRYNANLIAQGVSYQERKSMLEAHANRQRAVSNTVSNTKLLGEV